MRIVVPDLVSNSYFPALAAEDLGRYAAEGLEAHVEVFSRAPSVMAALRDGAADAVASRMRTGAGALRLPRQLPVRQTRIEDVAQAIAK